MYKKHNVAIVFVLLVVLVLSLAVTAAAFAAPKSGKEIKGKALGIEKHREQAKADKASTTSQAQSQKSDPQSVKNDAPTAAILIGAKDKVEQKTEIKAKDTIELTAPSEINTENTDSNIIVNSEPVVASPEVETATVSPSVETEKEKPYKLNYAQDQNTYSDSKTSSNVVTSFVEAVSNFFGGITGFLTSGGKSYRYRLIASPSSDTVLQGASATTIVTTELLAGSTRLVSFSCSNLPSGASCSFNPTSCDPTCTTAATVTTSSSTPTGTYAITITGKADKKKSSTTYTLTVNSAQPFDFSLSLSSASGSVIQGSSASTTTTATLLSGTSQLVSFSASGLPAGAAISFNPTSCNPTCNSVTTITTSATTPAGTYPITISGTGGGLTRTATYTLTVTSVSFDFSVSASPTSGSVSPGGSTTTTTTATLTSGTSQSVSFSASGLPAGATISFNPTSGLPTFSSTATISTSGSTPTGTYPITITGTGGGLTRTASYSLNVATTPTGFVTTSGTKLTLDGKDFKFIGFNMFGAANYETLGVCGPGNNYGKNIDTYLDKAFAQLSSKGVNGVRFWAFQKFTVDSTGTRNWAAIDKVIFYANKYGIKLMPVLENHWGDCNGYGQKSDSWYQTGYKTGGTGGYAKSFRDYSIEFAQRYVNEPAIMMIDILNEPEGDHASLKNFVQDVSQAIDAVDKNHIITVGTIGTGQRGIENSNGNYRDLFNVATVDLCQAHDYNLPRDSWPNTNDNSNGVRISYQDCTNINKPFAEGEAGIRDNFCDGRYGGYTSWDPECFNKADRSTYFDSKIGTAFSKGVDGYVIWQWDNTQTNLGTSCNGYDDYCVTEADPLLDVIQKYSTGSGGSGVFDFSMSVNPTSGSTQQGGSKTTAVTATLTGNITQSVSFSCTGLPSGASCTFNPTSCTPTCTSTATVSTSGSTPAGTYPISIVGTGGGLTRSATYTLTVTAAPFDFSVTVNPTSGSVNPGSSISTTTKATLISGNAQSVSFSASGQPPGATISFSPTSCSPTCTSTTTISTSGSTPLGTYSITITGTGGGLTRTTTYTLTVTNTPPSSSFLFATAGDHGIWNDFDATRTRLGSSNAKFYIALGDLSYSLGREQEWCTKIKSNFNDVELITGNHDTLKDSGDGNLTKYVTYCPWTSPGGVSFVPGPDYISENPIVTGYGVLYYFDYPATNPMMRMILGSFGIGGSQGYSTGSANYNWVSNAIDDARAKNIPWVFVGMHKNCITAGGKSCEIQQNVLDLFIKKKVDIIFQGHEHDYQRGKQLACASDNTCPRDGSFDPKYVVDDGSDGLYTKGAGSIINIIGTGGVDMRSDGTLCPNPNSPPSKAEACYFAKLMDAYPGNSPGWGFGFGVFNITADRLDMKSDFSSSWQDSYSIIK